MLTPPPRGTPSREAADLLPAELWERVARSLSGEAQATLVATSRGLAVLLGSLPDLELNQRRLLSAIRAVAGPGERGGDLGRSRPKPGRHRGGPHDSWRSRERAVVATLAAQPERAAHLRALELPRWAIAGHRRAGPKEGGVSALEAASRLCPRLARLRLDDDRGPFASCRVSLRARNLSPRRRDAQPPNLVGAFLSRFAGLTELVLRHDGAEPLALASLSTLSRLRYLRLDGSRSVWGRLDDLGPILENLTSLSLLDCRDIVPSFTAISRLIAMRDLALHRLPEPDYESLPWKLERDLPLERLRVQWDWDPDLCERTYPRLPRLARLRIDTTWEERGPRGLSHLPGLTRLELTSAPHLHRLSDEMSTLTALEELQLADCPLLCHGHLDLDRLRRLRRVELEDLPELGLLFEGPVPPSRPVEVSRREVPHICLLSLLPLEVFDGALGDWPPHVQVLVQELEASYPSPAEAAELLAELEAMSLAEDDGVVS